MFVWGCVEMLKIASVSIDNPSRELDRLFDYIIPEHYINILKIGMRVMVPFGGANKLIQAIVLEIKDIEECNIKYKEIYDVVDDEPILSMDLIELAYFIKHKYICTLSEALFSMLPPEISQKEVIEVKLLEYNTELNKREREFLSSLPKDRYVKLDMASIKLKRVELLNLKNKGIIDLKIGFNQSVNKKTIEFCKIKDFEKVQHIINDKEVNNKE